MIVLKNLGSIRAWQAVAYFTRFGSLAFHSSDRTQADFAEVTFSDDIQRYPTVKADPGGRRQFPQAARFGSADVQLFEPATGSQFRCTCCSVFNTVDSFRIIFVARDTAKRKNECSGSVRRRELAQVW